MFTGIVEAIGVLKRRTENGRGAEIEIYSKDFDFTDVCIGDSIACNGVCVTVVTLGSSSFSANISHETIKCTTFSSIKVGDALNLEKALTPTTHLGGHIVSGHVDVVGTIKSILKKDDVIDLWINVPHSITRYIAHKGSITIDGVSLTVNELDNDDFRLTLIPHTHKVTTADNWQKGQKVNVEIDLLARYMERLLQFNSTDNYNSSGTVKKSTGITRETLFENGFF
jgi:riboflavin synthase